MSRAAITQSPVVIALNRLILLLMLLALAAAISAAMVMQYAFGELPCPLCLLQRVAMFGVCFGIIQQVRDGTSVRSTGLSLIFTILLLVISVRQTLLDLFPRPGHEYTGGAIFGIHMPVWSVIIAMALLLGFAAKLALFGGPHTVPKTEGKLISRFAHGLCIYVIVICAINFISVVVQCGLGVCHTSGYKLL
jgi:disulfide bond formation protein DsbB